MSGFSCDWTPICASRIGIEPLFISNSDHFHPARAVWMCATHQRQARRQGFEFGPTPDGKALDGIQEARREAQIEDRVDSDFPTGYIGEFE